MSTLSIKHNKTHTNLQNGLYVITNEMPLKDLLEKLPIILSSPVVRLIQYRRKNTKKQQQAQEVEQILAVTQQYSIPLIINDSVSLAQQFGLGVHLGQTDGSINQARQLLGNKVIIGATCHNSFDLAQQAILGSANYVAFGAVFGTQSKQVSSYISVQQLQHMVSQVNLQYPNVKTCAIGGLNSANAQVVIQAGVNYCAVIQDIWTATHLEQKLQDWQKLF